MARIRKNETQRAILLRKTVVLRYIFTSEVGWATKLTLIRKIFKVAPYSSFEIMENTCFKPKISYIDIFLKE